MTAPRVAFLWHLHQPDYRDPVDGRPLMPWVRLHALRGYRDLILETVEQGTPWTLNVVPSLLDQLLALADGPRDRVHELQRCSVEEAAEVADEVVATLPSGHPTMTRIHPRWAALRAELEGGRRPGMGEIRDVQVWSLLAWFGATAHRDFPELGELVRKGGAFSEDDRATLIGVQDRILAEVPSWLRRLGEVSVSCSPYYHPILPLVVDARHARRCMPDLPDGVRYAWPEDALRQMVSARDRVETLCGARPVGLWPSEGSVSPEVVALAAEAGYRWLATDHGVLWRSEREGVGQGGWDLGHGVVGLFRDTDLSDRVGFRYADRDPREAADDLVAHAAHRAGDGTVLIALDGENPWECFADAGAAFRRELRAALAKGPLRAVTADAAARHPVVGRVRELWTGSWIGADFRIWIGHDDDRRAWRMLARLREAVEEAPAGVRESAMRHVLAAEGSDWFWWFGDDFRTSWKWMFDLMFREHVAAGWRALGLPVPDEVTRPIATPEPAERTEPLGRLAIDERHPDAWLAWSRAGEVLGGEGAMARAAAVRRLRFGWDVAGALWVRAEARGRWDVPGADAVWQVGDGLVARFDGGSAEVALVDPEGVCWPDVPLRFRPEAPSTWWAV